MNPDVFFETVLPLLGVDDAAMVCISTPLQAENFFSRLKTLKDDDGDPLMKVIHLTTVCSECRKLPEDQHKDCTHTDDTCQPPWKSSERYERARIYQQADPNVGRNARENMGLVAGDHHQALLTGFVKKLFDYDTRPYYECLTEPDRIYVMTDPDAGGASRLSILSGFVLRNDEECLPGTLVIIGVDFESCDSDLDQEALVKLHIRKIRSMRLYQKSKIILVPENMTGHHHTHMERVATEFPNCLAFHQKNEGKPGVCKDPRKTKEYLIRVNDMLKDDLIRFSTEWFTHSERRTMINKSKEGVLEELRDELLRYGYDEHGKLTGKFEGYQDDLYVAFAMLCYWSYIIEVIPYYESYRERAI